MPLAKRSQEHYRELMAGALALEDAARLIFELAAGTDRFVSALDTIDKLHAQADRLKAHANELKDGPDLCRQAE